MKAQLLGHGGLGVWRVAWCQDRLLSCGGRRILLWGRHGENWVLDKVILNATSDDSSANEPPVISIGKDHSTPDDLSNDQIEQVIVPSLPIVNPEVHTRTIRSVTWSRDGSRFAAACFDGTTSIWQKPWLEPLCKVEGHSSEVKSVAWSPNGEQLATCSRDKTVVVHQLVNDEAACVSIIPRHTQGKQDLSES